MELSQQAFYEAWKYFKMGTKPLVLNVLPQGVMESERRRVENRAWDELRRHGFGNRDDEDDIYGALLPLHKYDRAFDITYRYLEGGKPHTSTGMVANVRANATLAVLTEESVRVSTLRADAMVRAILSVLPEVKPGPGRGISVRSKQFDAAAATAGESDRAMTEGLMRQGVRRADAKAIVEMAGADRTAFAQFGASMTDRGGHRSRAPMVTNAFATSRGWYLMEESHSGSEPWTTIAPIDRQRLGSRIQDLLKAIGPE